MKIEFPPNLKFIMKPLKSRIIQSIKKDKITLEKRKNTSVKLTRMKSNLLQILGRTFRHASEDKKSGKIENIHFSKKRKKLFKKLFNLENE